MQRTWRPAPKRTSARWTLSGTDAGDFSIGSTSGVLTFRAAPDFDAPTDANMDNVYMVTVEADDRTYTDTHNVTVTITEVDDGTVTPMPEDTLLDRYDDNDDDVISKQELLVAVSNFFDAEIDKAMLLEVVGLYFDSL